MIVFIGEKDHMRNPRGAKPDRRTLACVDRNLLFDCNLTSAIIAPQNNAQNKEIAPLKLLGMTLGLSLTLVLAGCGTFRSHDGPRADAPRIYSGVRLDLAALRGNAAYIERYKLTPPSYPVVDLPFSFAFDSLLLPLALFRTGYQILAVPPGGW